MGKLLIVPSQFERRKERNLEPRDTWFYAWVAVFAIGIVIFVLIDERVGSAFAVSGGAGFILLAFKRGAGDLPWGGGTP